MGLTAETLAQRTLERVGLRTAPARAHRLARYQADIAGFVRDVLRVEPAPYQEDILRAFVARRRVAVRGPHGLGKTALSAWVVLWGVTCFADREVKVVTTASAWRQLIQFTWPEIRKWAGQVDWAAFGVELRPGKELLALSIRHANRRAFAAASDNPALIEGAHASLLIYVFDEAKAIPAGMWDAAEGAFSTGEAFALAISTPGEPSGRFYDIHARKAGLDDWWTRHVSLEEAIGAGRINPEWAEQRRRQWGEASAVYQNRVLGEFADSGDDAVIPLAWVEAANERWRELDGKGPGGAGLLLGVDPAWRGEDRSTIAWLRGNVCERIEAFASEDTMQLAGRVVVATGGDPQARIVVDVVGIGAGVYDRLREQGYNVTALNAGERTDRSDESGTLSFLNVRSAMWWALRERLDPNRPDALALPPVDELTGDLTAPRWSVTSTGHIKIESKDDIRSRIGRSTDYADALGAAVWGVGGGIGVWV